MPKPGTVLVTETVRRLKEVDKFSHDLKVGDEFRIGGLLVQIERILTNDHDQRVLFVEIIGASIKKRSKMTLIVPKMVPFSVLIEKDEEIETPLK
jgi:hypothetical protein